MAKNRVIFLPIKDVLQNSGGSESRRTKVIMVITHHDVKVPVTTPSRIDLHKTWFHVKMLSAAKWLVNKSHLKQLTPGV